MCGRVTLMTVSLVSFAGEFNGDPSHPQGGPQGVHPVLAGPTQGRRNRLLPLLAPVIPAPCFPCLSHVCPCFVVRTFGV